VIELLLQTGMRLSDVSRIKVTDASLPTRIAKEPGSAGAAHILGKGPAPSSSWWPSTWQRRASMAPRSTRSGTPSAPTRSSRCTKLRVAREVLGHSSLETTSIYVGLAGKTWTGREDMDRQLQEMRYRPVQRFSTAMCTDGSLVRDG
jgi:integrase